MSEGWFTELFDRERPRLRAVAYRLLGSADDAEDAVQEAWLRLNRTESRELDNVSAWLTTVVARIALDLLRKRGVRAAVPLDGLNASDEDVLDASIESETADAVGSALDVVLEQLSPPERLAFVLHDVFGIPFDEIGAILDRTPSATKQLASRARNKVRGVDASSRPDRVVQRKVVDAFLTAARRGDFEALIDLLHPDVMLDPDAAAVRMGAPTGARGATAVARIFCGRALAAQSALVDGSVGMAWIVTGRTRVAWNVFIEGDRIVHIDMHADPDTITALSAHALD
jgi:RNA polymerase sigma factor (sigma-70 family)